jgi:two-component system OmpR family sensor kinase
VHTPPEGPVEVTVGEEAAWAVLAVADRGPGIPPEERQRIFEPFQRLDPSRQRATGGLGLGLAIVAALVRAHGGQVVVEDRPGGGALFQVRLPRVAVDGSPREGGQGSPRAEEAGPPRLAEPAPPTAAGVEATP